MVKIIWTDNALQEFEEIADVCQVISNFCNFDPI